MLDCMGAPQPLSMTESVVRGLIPGSAAFLRVTLDNPHNLSAQCVLL